MLSPASESQQNSIPILPDDVMVMIFNQLTTEERVPICTSCKRFREIDIQFGKRFFESIDIALDQPNVGFRIIGKLNHFGKWWCKGSSEHTIYGNSSGLIQPNYNNIRLFGKSKTEFLKLYLNRGNIAPSEYHFLANLCENIVFTRLSIEVRSDHACIGWTFDFLKKRDLNTSQVFLNIFGHYVANKAQLLQLPHIGKFKLAWFAKDPPYNANFLDCEALLHIVSHTIHAELGDVRCTAKGLLDAFKVVRETPGYKYVVLKVPKAAFVDILPMARQHNFVSGVAVFGRKQYIRDPQSNSVLLGPNSANLGSANFVEIEMGRFDHNHKGIPLLPDDVMLMIFNELTTEERTPITTSCKKFREIDIEYGKRFFESIDVTLDRPHQGSRIAGKVSRNHYIYGNSSRQILPTYNNIRLFGKSKTDFLRIIIHRDSIAPSEYYFLLNSCEKISFKKVHINVRCDYACIERMFEFIKNRDLSKAQVFLDLYCNDNVCDTPCDLLMQLQQVDKFKLNWFENYPYQTSPKVIIDDAALLHIICITNHAELGETRCTTQGIIDAFKVFCDFPDYKYLSLKVSSSEYARVLKSPDWTDRFIITNNREVYDFDNGCKLVGPFRSSSNYFVEIEMGKVDNALSELRYEPIGWD